MPIAKFFSHTDLANGVILVNATETLILDSGPFPLIGDVVPVSVHAWAQVTLGATPTLLTLYLYRGLVGSGGVLLATANVSAGITDNVNAQISIAYLDTLNKPYQGRYSYFIKQTGATSNGEVLQGSIWTLAGGPSA